MGTNTTNYSFSKPTVDGDEDSWGTQLNGNWDKTDSLLSGGQDISSLSITTSVTLKGQADLVLKDADSSHSVSLQAPATIGTNFTLTLPAADGSSGQVIQTDGSGNLSFVDQSGGGGSGDSIADADGDTKIQVEESTDDDTIRFDTAGSERMVVTNTGLVGLGIATPSTDLHLFKTTGDVGITVQSSATANAKAFVDLYGRDASNVNQIWKIENDAHSLTINDDGTERMLIKPTGQTEIKGGTTAYATGNNDGVALKVTAYNSDYGLNLALDTDSSVTNAGVRIRYANGGTLKFMDTVTDNYIRYDWNGSGWTALSDQNQTRFLNRQDIYSCGQIRATGWYNTPTGTTGTGAAMEIGVSGSTAYVHGYNRDSSSYLPVNVTGSGITLNGRNTDPQVTLSGTTNQVMRYTGSATSPYIRFTTSGTANGYIQWTTSHSYFWNDRASRGIRISSGGVPGFYNGSSYDDLHRNSYSVDMIANQAYSDNWFRCNGDQGLYWQSRGRGITSPEQQGNSYGNTTTYGTGRSSWQGYGISNDFTFMGRDNVDMGCHDSVSGWAWYWHQSNDCMGVASSSTSSSYELYVSGKIYATSNITAYSDRRSKENIITIDNALDKTLAMRGVYYTRRFGEDKSRQVGVIAQEMLEPEACPEAVTYAEDVDEYGVSYGNLVGVLIEAIKELKGQVDDLQAQVQELQG